MKIATFNMENIFHREESLVRKSVSHSLAAWIEELEELMNKDSRVTNDFTRMRELSFLLGFHKSALEPYVVMRRKAGQLYLRERNATLEYKASHLSNWNGWIKLNTKPINEIAVQNKARLITEVNPDILILQEVEDRQSLVEFNEHFLPEGVRFSDIIVLPGNNSKGLEMGIMAKNGYKIEGVKSHVNDMFQNEKLFDKDFQEYEIIPPDGEKIIILSAHLIDTVENKEVSDKRRKKQAHKIAEVYDAIWGRGNEKIVVAGTLNALSYCNSLSPILRETGILDIKKHRSFNVDLDEGKDADYYSLGAYRMGVNTKQKDYLLLSPEFLKEVKNAGLNRKGIWPARKNQYRVYSSMQSECQQASSHPILWAEI